MTTSGTGLIIPRDLERRYAEGEVVLFVGSGASLAAGAVGWRDLLRRLVHAAAAEGKPLRDGDDLDQLIAGPPSDLILAAGYLKTLLGKRLFGRCIHEQFGDLQPTEIHRAIARMHLAGVVTTNFDCLLETVLPDWTIVLPGNEMNLDARNFIIKLHGSCQPEPHKVVIAPGDYKDVMGHARLVATMNMLYSRYTFLFIGFGLSDPDTVATLEPLRDVFGETWRQHYALMSSAEVGPIRERDLEQRLNVRLLKYSIPDGDHAEAVAFLEQLAGSYVHDTRRDVDRTLVVMGARSLHERSTRVLVKVASESWLTEWGLPYMLPNMKPTDDPLKVQAWVAREFGLPLESVNVKRAGPLYSSKNKKPGAGDESGVYRFRHFEITLKPTVDGSAAVYSQIGGRPARWMTLTELKAHKATMSVNGDPICRLGDLFGSDQEDLSISATLP
jgi:hypothetical protein